LEQASKLDPQDAYSAIWLDLVRRREGLPSILEDTKLDMTKWPGPVVRMLMGELTLEATVAAADRSDATVRKERTCEANFYAAEFLRLQHHDGEALRLYRLALDDCPRDFIEYTATVMALRSSGNAP